MVAMISYLSSQELSYFLIYNEVRYHYTTIFYTSCGVWINNGDDIRPIVYHMMEREKAKNNICMMMEALQNQKCNEATGEIKIFLYKK